MPSFDVVSEIDLFELKNAVENASRELSTRFDFRGVDASIALEKQVAKLGAEHDSQLRQLADILRANLVKRGVDASTMELDTPTYNGKKCSQTVKFKEGIDKEIAKKLVKLIKAEKLKVQVAIQGEELRVTGKKRDDLQTAMAFVKRAELGQPFQFKNLKD